MEGNLYFDLFKLSQFEIIFNKSPVFLNACAIYSELPSNISTMGPNVMVSRERERKSYFPHAFNWNFATGGIDYLACTASYMGS